MTNTQNTKHAFDCERVFNRYDKKCLRCQELISGSKPRDGWQKNYYIRKAKEKKIIASEFARHYASEQHKNEVVCTFGDW